MTLFHHVLYFICQIKLYHTIPYHIEIRPLNIVNALKSVNKGKACGVDGLAAENFIYADEYTHVILSILFNCFCSWAINYFLSLKRQDDPLL